MFQAISDIMAQLYHVNALKINCALKFIMSNHHGTIVLSSLVQLEKSNDMFKVISDIMVQYLVQLE